jgi:hypothetical protein
MVASELATLALRKLNRQLYFVHQSLRYLLINYVTYFKISFKGPNYILSFLSTLCST